MSSNASKRMPIRAKKEWPIQPGSPLYRALEMIAQEIVRDRKETTARELLPEKPKGEK